MREYFGWSRYVEMDVLQEYHEIYNTFIDAFINIF